MYVFLNISATRFRKISFAILYHALAVKNDTQMTKEIDFSFLYTLMLRFIVFYAIFQTLWSIHIFHCIWSNDDVIKSKHFPRNWLFVRGIHRIPHTKASDAELWCFLWSASEYTVE